MFDFDDDGEKKLAVRLYLGSVEPYMRVFDKQEDMVYAYPFVYCGFLHAYEEGCIYGASAVAQFIIYKVKFNKNKEENRKHELYNTIQVKPYYLQKKEFGKKNCSKMDNGGYAVSKQVRDDLLQLGATEGDFWPVYTKQKEIVCYQLMPQNKISLKQVNGWEKKLYALILDIMNIYTMIKVLFILIKQLLKI